MSDLIDRQVALDKLNELKKVELVNAGNKPSKSYWALQAALMVVSGLPSAEPDGTDTNVGGTIYRQAAIDKFIDGLEEIFADLRERHVDDSVCGLCEYDGAYIGQSGDWCNECPGFDKDDCFKLSDKIRKEWADKIIKALPPAQQWIPCSERLPEDGRQVLVYARSVHFALAKYDEMREADGTYEKQWVTFDAWKPFYTIKDVIAWMPLPEPYTER